MPTDVMACQMGAPETHARRVGERFKCVDKFRMEAERAVNAILLGDKAEDFGKVFFGRFSERVGPCYPRRASSSSRNRLMASVPSLTWPLSISRTAASTRSRK